MKIKALQHNNKELRRHTRPRRAPSIVRAKCTHRPAFISAHAHTFSLAFSADYGESETRLRINNGWPEAHIHTSRARIGRLRGNKRAHAKTWDDSSCVFSVTDFAVGVSSALGATFLDLARVGTGSLCPDLLGRHVCAVV